MIGVAAALARCGHIPFVHTFGVFATRRPFDQIVNAVAYPGLPVRIIGFMPGISSPGGPSHQAIDDVALMRAIPGMTVIDHADVLTSGDDVALFASGMMLAPALAAAAVLRAGHVGTRVVNVPVIKPLDVATVAEVSAACRIVLTAENHLTTGGLGSAVAEALAEAGLGRPLRRIGLPDTFAEGAARAPYLFEKYGLSVQSSSTPPGAGSACPARLQPPTSRQRRPASTRRYDGRPPVHRPPHLPPAPCPVQRRRSLS